MHKQTTLNWIPGILLSLVISVVANFIANVFPWPVLSASVIALFLGIGLNHVFNDQVRSTVSSGVNFVSKRVLKFAIILLGASLNVTTIMTIGQLSVPIMIFTFLTCFGAGYFIGKAFGINWKMSNLISAGMAICGGTAIASISPMIDAEETDIAYAMSTTFIIDMFLIIVFPLVGQLLGMSDIAYGLWAGTAVNDTSSVVAAGYAFSEAAGDFATMIKLTRTLLIIPTVVVFALIYRSQQARLHQTAGNQGEIKFSKSFPWFILGFLFMSFAHSIGWISGDIAGVLKTVSRFLMVVALASIGLKTSIDSIKQAGWKPMVFGIIISVLAIIVSLIVISQMGHL